MSEPDERGTHPAAPDGPGSFADQPADPSQFFGTDTVTDALGQPDAASGLAGQAVDERRASLRADAFRQLKKNPLFLASLVLIAFFLLMAVFPQLFADPERVSQQAGACQLSQSLQAPSSEHWFGTDQQGCDVYARTIYGARASITVGILVTLFTTLLGGLIGTLAGYYGRWVDSVLSRIVDIFFGLPLLLGGLVFLSVLQLSGIWGVVVAMSVLGWTSAARIARSSVISTKNMDYVQAARAMGAHDYRIITRHVLPNSLAPVIVVAMISLGGFIATEATFSFLGIGVQPPTISWGVMIAEAQNVFAVAPWTLIIPAGALSLTVLSFILMGDAVRDAFDPKLS